MPDVRADLDSYLLGLEKKITSLQRAISNVQNIDPWHVVGAEGEPAYQNGWSGNLRFRRRSDGMVRIEGTASNGSSASVIFYLPAGYASSLQHYEIVLGDGGAAGNYVLFRTNGAVEGVRTGPNIYFGHDVDTNQ